MARILIVEDDGNQRKLLAGVLGRAGHDASTADCAEQALHLLEDRTFDLAVLDVMLPGMDGFELTRLLRGSDRDIPILTITAKGLPGDKRRGFLAGTDDYMTKPVDLDEMLLRIRALLRRSRMAHGGKMRIGEVVLDSDALSVSRGDDRQTLPLKEFLLLCKLLSHPGLIFTRLQLMDDIWGMGSESREQTVDVHISRLRRRFEHYPEFDLVSVRGLGYKAVIVDGKSLR